MTDKVKEPFKQMELKVHPAADLFPHMEPAELGELAESIKRNGLREKLVVTTDGVLVDGRNRFAAMTLAEIPLKDSHVQVVDFDALPYSIEEYVTMANLERRNLNREQRRELSGKLAVMMETAQSERPKADKVDTTEAAAAAAGVSRRTAADAKQQVLVDLGLRKPPTPQNDSKKKRRTKKDQASARPPSVIKNLRAVVDNIELTGDRWPEAPVNRREEAVTFAIKILAAFPITTAKAKWPANVAGILGLDGKKVIPETPAQEIAKGAEGKS